jgi:PKHD-type hydroxylase
MLLQIANILSAEECRVITDALSPDGLWLDDKSTAKGEARAVIENQQANRENPKVRGVISLIEEKIANNPVVIAAAQPEAFVGLTLNRYRNGMSYGAHVDAPYMLGQRTDLSFTVFLNSPESYEGGELVIENAGHDDAVRGAAGSAVLYPSKSVHRVEPVTSGARLACVGWIKSRVRSAENRALLYELETVLADLRSAGAPLPVYNRLLNVKNNLLRTFGE